MDDMDRAQAREEQLREDALAALQRRIAAAMAPPDPAVAGLCIDCDGSIEPERMTALRGCTSRCSSCAHAYEAQQRGPR